MGYVQNVDLGRIGKRDMITRAVQPPIFGKFVLRVSIKRMHMFHVGAINHVKTQYFGRRVQNSVQL